MVIHPKRIEFIEGEPVLLVARNETAGGTPLTPAQVSSFSISIFLLGGASETPGAAVYKQGFETDLGYYDELQYDDAANLLEDSGGYNFKFVLDADDFLFEGERNYRIQVASVIGSSTHTALYDAVPTGTL